MNQSLTEREVNKIRKMCFDNPSKSCAVAQEIINYCQIMSINTFAKLAGKHRNTVLQQKDKLLGVEIEGRKYLLFPQ